METSPTRWTPGSLAARLGGDAQLARELVAIFLAEYPALLHELLTHVARGDAAGVRHSSHALRGAVTNFIDTGPTLTALALERAASESRRDEVVRLAEQLQREIESLAAAMRSFPGTDPCVS